MALAVRAKGPKKSNRAGETTDHDRSDAKNVSRQPDASIHVGRRSIPQRNRLDFRAAEFIQSIFQDFNALKKFQDRLLRFLESLDLVGGEAEDAVLDAFLKAAQWQAQGKLSGIKNPEAWLRQIALRNARTALRRWKDHKEVGTEGPAVPASTELEDKEDKEFRIAVVRESFSRLRDEQQQVLRLCDYEGLTIRETADRLGITHGSASGIRTTVRERAKIPAFPDNAVPTRPGVMAVSSWSVPSS